MATATLGSTPSTTRWNTLQILRIARGAVLALTGLVLIAIVAGTRVHRTALTNVGRDTVPSIIAAQHIRAALADMDAEAAKDLLSSPNSGSASMHAYETRRVEAAKALIEAAENITYGDAERTPVLALQVGLGTYERLAQKARDLHATNNPAAVPAYADAAAVMDDGLLPAADALDKANNDVLERTYRTQSNDAFAARTFLVLASLSTLLALIGVQVFLSRRTRRTFNPLLLAGTLLLLVLTVHALSAMSSSQHDLKVAKEDAFASIHALWRARAVAYEANSEESRYLLDPTRASASQRSFLANVNIIAKTPDSLSPDQLLAALRNGGHVDGFSGYLADEMNNVTFRGEREAAIDTLAGWEQYVALDGQIRKLERTGQHRQAIELCVGTSPGQSSSAFANFDHTLGATLDINQGVFDASVRSGFSALSALEVEAAVAVVAVALLVFSGIAPRIHEYQ